MKGLPLTKQNRSDEAENGRGWRRKGGRGRAKESERASEREREGESLQDLDLAAVLVGKRRRQRG